MSRSVSDVSIVTVNWNGKQHLEQLLPSLTGLGALEILVVDNGSSDGSQDFLRKRYPAVRVLQNATNRGFAQPNNLAAEHARGSCLALINNDMRVHQDWLSAALARLDGPVACVGSRILDWEGRRIDFNGSSLQYLGYALQRDIGRVLEEVSHADRLLFACGGAMLIDRDIFRQVGGFDESYFAIFEDVDLGWRLWLAGFEVAFAPDSLAYHRGHGTFRAHESEKMRYLMHRNALLTVLKNYEEETVRRILPLAFILAVKRAVLFSGVEKERFYLWADSRERWEKGDPAAVSRVVDALNHIVVLDDVLEGLPGVLKERAKVQFLRKRPDSEILALFKDPFRPIVEDAGYRRIERGYGRLLGLDKLFGCVFEAPFDSADTAELHEKADILRRELQALQWQQGDSMQHPAGGMPGSRRARLLRAWRSGGFREVWRRFMEQVDRGL